MRCGTARAWSAANCSWLLSTPITRTEAFQVLSNLVSNAVHATQGGGSISIAAALVEDGAMVKARLIVADDGQGMAPDVVDRALDPFYTTKPPGVGVGLGLATVATIVQGWGGSVTIESERGMGTKVIIELAERRSSKADETAARQVAATIN